MRHPSILPCSFPWSLFPPRQPSSPEQGWHSWHCWCPSLLACEVPPIFMCACSVKMSSGPSVVNPNGAGAAWTPSAWLAHIVFCCIFPAPWYTHDTALAILCPTPHATCLWQAGFAPRDLSTSAVFLKRAAQKKIYSLIRKSNLLANSLRNPAITQSTSRVTVGLFAVQGVHGQIRAGVPWPTVC